MSRYDHRHHAGNIGDVWKHVGWLAMLAAFKRDRLQVIDLHAGCGLYHLDKHGGEWTRGVGLLRERHPAGRSTGSGALDRYLARLPEDGRYLGSPLLAHQALGKSDKLLLYESDPETAASLRAALPREGRVRIVGGDGWEAPELLRPAEERTLVLVDPPYSDKEDWSRAASALQRAHAAGHAAIGWYPVKRLTRPAALRHDLEARGVPHVALELLLTPLSEAKDRMIGSGLLLVSAPSSVTAELCAAAPAIGAALATSARWSLSVYGSEPVAAPAG